VSFLPAVPSSLLEAAESSRADPPLLVAHSTALAWHPTHDDLLVSGGSEGSIIHWSMPDATPKDVLEFAHDSNVWSLAFHPLGHILCSASNDHTTRFWSRGRPGRFSLS
jgi:WD40 repeat protein